MVTFTVTIPDEYAAAAETACGIDLEAQGIELDSPLSPTVERWCELRLEQTVTTWMRVNVSTTPIEEATVDHNKAEENLRLVQSERNDIMSAAQLTVASVFAAERASGAATR